MQAGARGLALRIMAHTLATALLVEQATGGDEPAGTAARPWARWLRGEDIATDAHHLDQLG